MKYIGIVKSTNQHTLGAPPAALMEAIEAQGKEAGAKLIEGGGMLKTGLGRVRGGTLTLDGPYAETKEVVAGYAIYELESDKEMTDWARAFLELHQKHWPQWEGEVEILQLMKGTD